MKPQKRNATRPVLAWGGFCDGRLFWHEQNRDTGTTVIAIFTSRRAARRLFADVRRVRITEVKR